MKKTSDVARKKSFLIVFLLGVVHGIVFMVILTNIETSRFFSHPLKTQHKYYNTSDRSYNYHTSNRSYNYVKEKKREGNSRDKLRILCWVLTQPNNLATKGEAVKNTWAKRCNIVLFMSSVENKELPAVGLGVPEGRHNLWLKTRAAWKYVYENHFNDADWFIKADDDTYVVMENLHNFVSKYNYLEPHYFGCQFALEGGYNSGGAGYVFSKETLNRFYNIMDDTKLCSPKGDSEDVNIGVCLKAINITTGDTRDKYGRETFHPLIPEHHLSPGVLKSREWLYSYNKWKTQWGRECCSDNTITFHYVSDRQMYVLEWFIYNMRVIG